VIKKDYTLLNHHTFEPYSKEFTPFEKEHHYISKFKNVIKTFFDKYEYGYNIIVPNNIANNYVKNHCEYKSKDYLSTIKDKKYDNSIK
jgi:hypothetical protein